MELRVLDMRTDTVSQNTHYRCKCRLHNILMDVDGKQQKVGDFWVAIDNLGWSSVTQFNLAQYKNRIKEDLCRSELNWFFTYNLITGGSTPAEIIAYMKSNQLSFSYLIARPASASETGFPVSYVKAEIKEKSEVFLINFLHESDYDDFMKECRAIQL